MGNGRFFLRYIGVVLPLLGGAMMVSGPYPVSVGLEEAGAGPGLPPSRTEPAPGSGLSPAPSLKVEKAYGRLPIYFIENRGQVDRRVKLYARAGGQTLWFTREGVCFTLARAAGPPAAPENFTGKAPRAEMRRPRAAKPRAARPLVVRLIPCSD